MWPMITSSTAGTIIRNSSSKEVTSATWKITRRLKGWLKMEKHEVLPWKLSCSCDFAIQQHRESAFWPESGAEVKHIYTRGVIYNAYMWYFHERVEQNFTSFFFLSWCVFYLINQIVLPKVCTMWLLLWLSGNWSGFLSGKGLLSLAH